MTPRYLPGMEDLPGPTGWADVFDRLEYKPARKVVMRALRVIAGSRPECSPSNAAIRSAIAGLGFDPPGDREISVLLRKLEVDDQVIRRTANERAGSQRRIHFRFINLGADDLRPWAQTTCAPGRRRPAPLGADDLRPSSPQVMMLQPPAPESVSPLNSIQIQREETLTLTAPTNSRPDLVHRGDHAQRTTRPDEIMARLFRRAPEIDAQQAASPAPASKSPAPPEPPHIETVDRLRRLASPCGPEAVEAAAAQAAKLLRDESSIGYYRKVCDQVRRGELPVKVAVDAFRQARSPTAKTPGAVFVAFIKEHAPPGSAQKPTPGATCQVPRGPAQRSVPTAFPTHKCIRSVNP